jgi:hypothetical protein
MTRRVPFANRLTWIRVLACDRHIIVGQAAFTSLSRFSFGLQTPTPGFHVELKRVTYDISGRTMLILGLDVRRQGGRRTLSPAGILKDLSRHRRCLSKVAKSTIDTKQCYRI